MSDVLCQRWNERRDSYRAASEPGRAYLSRCEVVSVSREDARAFVVRHHYSGSVPSQRRCHGLLHEGALVGVGIYGTPLRDCVLTSVFPGDANESAELARFVLLDEVPAPGETWMLARSRELLRREGFRGVVAFSDPLARETEEGRVVKPGHVGTIYQASNAVYVGQARPSYLFLLPDGTTFHRRALSKVRDGERNWEGAVERLVRYGAPAPRCLVRGVADVDELRAWIDRWLPRLTRRTRHPGNHKFAFPLTRADRRTLERRPRLAYPKRVA